MALQSINPATGEALRTFSELDDRQLAASLERAAQAFEDYRRTTFAQRADWLRSAGDILDAEKEDWARLMVREMGKTLTAAIAEAEKCAWVCRYYADHAAALLADEPIGTEADESFVRYLPLGPVLAVMPWNFPFWQVFRFAAPAPSGVTAQSTAADRAPGSAKQSTWQRAMTRRTDSNVTW